MATEKKDFFEGWEVLIGGVIRPKFREFCRKSLDQLRIANPELWLAVAWMYKKRPPSHAQFRTMLLGTATAGERVLDWFGKHGGLIGQLVDAFGEQMLEDIDGNMTDYFQDQPESVLNGYNGPKDGELKQIASELQKYLKTWSGQFVRRLPMLVDFRKDAMFGGAAWELALTLIVQPEETLRKYLAWYAQLDPRTKDRLKKVMPAINNTGEFDRFLALSETDMTNYINHTYETTRWMIFSAEEMNEAGRMFDQFVGQPANDMARDINAARLRLRRERGLEDQPRPTRRRRLSPFVPLGLAIMVFGLGLFWSSYTAMTTPAAQGKIELSFLQGTEPIAHAAPHYNWLALVIGIIGLVVFAVALTAQFSNNRRAN